MKPRFNRQPSGFRLAVASTLAAILAPGTITPTPTQSAPSQGREAISQQAPGKNDRATQQAPSTGGVVQMIRGMGPEPFALRGRGGHSPKDWGMSAACARMVRKNKLRRLGLGGQRI